MAKKLLSVATTTQNSTVYSWMGGAGTFVGENMGSGVVSLEASVDGGTNFVPVCLTGTVNPVVVGPTTDGAVPFQVGACKLRAVLSTASSTGANVWVL